MNSTSQTLSAAFALVLMSSLAACTKKNPANPQTQATAQPASDTAQATLPTDSGDFKIEDIKVGDGSEAIAGKTVSVLYKGMFPDGKIFDSSLNASTPFRFQLGSGQVIKGWDQVVAGMKVGGKRKLTVPPGLAYGATGAGGVIPPNATLVFEVDLLEVK
jgi:FKBP-type peptidyl-prolyl cis-trans isomerase